MRYVVTVKQAINKINKKLNNKKKELRKVFLLQKV